MERVLTGLMRFIATGFVMLVALPVWAKIPSDWKPVLVSPANESYIKPDGQIRIKIGKLSSSLFRTLVLELDDVDVTAIASRNGNILTLLSYQPLSTGQHELRLVEYASDGTILERGFWAFEVRETSLFREAELQSNLNLILSRRVHDDGLSDPPQRNSTMGSASLQGAAANANWRVTGNVDLIHNSDESQMVRNERTDLGHFLLQGRGGAVDASLGHHNPVPDSLIAQGFNRRGVSATLGDGNRANTITAFALRTENIIGTRDGLGVGKPDKRTEGMSFSFRPLTSQPQALVINATYLASEGASLGEAEGGEEFDTVGAAGGLVLDSQLLDRRLRLRGEIAQTRYDFDGRDTGFGAEEDRAHYLLAVYSPRQTLIDKQPLLLQFGIENKRLGTFFRSEANTAAASDVDLIRGFANLNWSGLGLQLSSGTETDNVNDIAGLGRTQLNQHVLSISYTPVLDNDPKTGEPIVPWYGSPGYSASFSTAQRDAIEAGNGFSNGALHKNMTQTLTASFTYQDWDWSISYVNGKDRDFQDLATESDYRQADLGFNFRFADELTLGFNLQRGELDDLDTRLSTLSELYGANLYWLYNEKLSFNFTYSLNRERADGDLALSIIPVQTRTRDVTLSLVWNVTQANGNHAGWQVSLDGSGNRFDDEINPEQSTDYRQVFLRVTANWSPGI